MNITRLTQDISALIETTLKNRSEELPAVSDIRHLLKDWGIIDVSPKVTYGTSLMGGSETDYIKLGAIHFALVQNYGLQPDGWNRYMMVVPLYISMHDRLYFFGVDTIPDHVVVTAREQLERLT